MIASHWKKSLQWLEAELPEDDINTWLRPLRAVEQGGDAVLMAPNPLVANEVRKRFLPKIRETLNDASGGRITDVTVMVGDEPGSGAAETPRGRSFQGSRLDKRYVFDNFVQGKSNQIARAASLQVARNLGQSYNPLLICGSSGLGKTHLMHSIGNYVRGERPRAKIVFVVAERFVNDMVNALRHNKINEFKEFYRSANLLLIDDIQFFAKKERSQEEFFHTFNALLEEGQQVVLTSDRYPRELDGIDDRLKNRFAGGMSVFIEPPDLETRAAILLKKAEADGLDLDESVAFFIAERIRSNVRELEAALKTLAANIGFTGEHVTVDFARVALQHMLRSHERLVTIEGIQKRVCEYFHIRRDDLLSSRRSRAVARPRQVAMALAKELTNHSLPEIGAAFGGRDHTTVLHACRKVASLREEDTRVDDDFRNLERELSL